LKNIHPCRKPGDIEREHAGLLPGFYRFALQGDQMDCLYFCKPVAPDTEMLIDGVVADPTVVE